MAFLEAAWVFPQYPSYLVHSFTLLLGLIVGSFLNVVVVRLPHDQSIVRPKSHCPACQHEMSWKENIPILSYVFLRGKCSHCKKPISIRYPIIEGLTALLFLAAEMKWGLSFRLLVRDWPFVSLLIAITFIDLEHRIIPDALSLGGLALGLATCWMIPELPWQQGVLGGLLGFGLFYALAWLYHAVKGQAGLGGGDVKLLGMLGAFLGPPGILAVIFISSIFGSVVGVSWALLTRKENLMKLSIPFGPFLVVGALYYYLLGDILWFQFMTPM